MSSLRPHHVGSERARLSSVDRLLRYFHDLPDNPSTATAFFEHWRIMATLKPGQLSPKQLSIIMDRTRQAWNAAGVTGNAGRNTGRATRVFGRNFRSQLLSEMHHWQRHALHVMPEFDGQALEMAITGPAALGIMPDDALFAAWTNRIKGKTPEAPIRELANIPMALSSLGRVMDAEYRAAWLPTIARRIDEFGPRTSAERFNADLARRPANILWALAVQDAIDPQAPLEYTVLARKLAAQVADFHDSAWTDQKTRSQIKDACMWFGIDNPAPDPYPRGNTTSSLERDLHNVFDEAGMRVLGDDRCRLRRLGKKADFAVRAQGGVVLVEADGDTHFTLWPDGRPRYNGKTLFQTALMHKTYPNRVFVRVPNTSLNSAVDKVSTSIRGLFDRLMAGPGHDGGAFVLALRDGNPCLRRLRA